LRLAYLVGRHQTSHTFIAREIDGLRREGIDVQRFAVRRAPRHELLTAAERRAATETDTLLPPPPGELLAAHLRALATRPADYLAALALALRLSPGGARATLWQLFYFAEAVLLWDRLRRRGIGHVHAHFANVASAVAMLAARIGRREGLSWSFTMHGPTEFDDVSRYALAEKVRRARFVACISEFCRSQLMKLVAAEHWERMVVVHCGVDPAHWAVAHRNGASGAGLHVLCVGRLVPEKGHGILLDALSVLRGRGLEVRATVVGDGPERAALEARARALRLGARVRFAGAVGQDRIGDLFAAADAFCLPSFAEGVPVVLMEAMATGLPVVTTQIMGVPELVRDGESGLLVAPGRPEAVADALARLAQAPDLRARMGAAARARVEDDYDVRAWSAVLARTFAEHAPEA
jgi:colanic acid/amylovoran biosynthesis glycosyltransferase